MIFDQINFSDLNDTSHPVSYTHLDVYKRQKLYCVFAAHYTGTKTAYSAIEALIGKETVSSRDPLATEYKRHIAKIYERRIEGLSLIHISKVLRELKQLKDMIEEYEKLSSKLEDAIALADMAIEENDESYVEEVKKEQAEIVEQEGKMRIELLLSGPYDRNNAIVSFHPGAGGTEAQDWASMLYRMITRWGEKHDYKVKMLDWLDGDEAGLKSATVMIEGINAYGYLKSEHGVHRLVRVSPFDAAGRRHTSFASIEVMPEFDEVEMCIRDSHNVA